MMGSFHGWTLECYERLNLSNLWIEHTMAGGEERSTVEEDC